MKPENMRFGPFIRTRRKEADATLQDVAEVIGISVSMLNDIEHGRRRPFEADKIKSFCKYLELDAVDEAELYDKAARENRKVPSDLVDTFLYSEVGTLCRKAIRMTDRGEANEEDWQEFLGIIENRVQ